MDKANITTTIWTDTLNNLRAIAGLTHESMVLILHRLISAELERVRALREPAAEKPLALARKLFRDGQKTLTK